jgi:hypothetical protein
MITANHPERAIVFEDATALDKPFGCKVIVNSEPVMRSVVMELDMPPITQVTNLTDIFHM